MLPSADRATDVPSRATALLLTSLFCCVQILSLRVNTHAAPVAPRPKGANRSHRLSPGPPKIAVLPSGDNATDVPWQALPTASVPTSFLPCCVQIPPLRVNTHAAPVLLLSDHPPTLAVFPSAERATDMPWRASPTAPLPTSFVPCCVQSSPPRPATHPPQPPPLRLTPQPAPPGRPTADRSRSALLGPGPPTIAVFPSADRATDMPWLVLPAAPVPTSLGHCWNV